MSLALIALLISGLSVAVASLSLGWNIYRDVLAKPRVNVRMGIRQVVEDGESVNGYVGTSEKGIHRLDPNTANERRDVFPGAWL